MKKFNKNNKNRSGKQLIIWSACLGLMALSAEVAASSNLATVASSITNTFSSVTRLITAVSYVGGLAFAIGAILAFKQHKDNPTQIPIGKPVGLLLVAAALLFLPSILAVTGETIFGTSGSVAGPTGTIFGQ